MRELLKEESYDFWFNNSEFDEHDRFGEKYYVNDFYKKIVFNLDIPENGNIVVMGTNVCITFGTLCEKYGENRCVGYDLYNPSNHPKVILKDCMGLSDEDNIPIAFAHNDIGSFPHTPDLKIHTQEWLAKNVIKGGYVLGNNNLNRAKYKVEEFMESCGFENTYFSDLDSDTFDLSMFPIERIEGYMISKKVGV